jgi:predicted enzyme related to lactoylglutathione lyase
MTDPLDVLATPVEPVRPSDAFAAGLRSRLERALSAPEGVAVSEVNLIETTDPSAPPSTVPVGVVPYLAVDGGRQAIEWYATALGAREVGERYESPDGRIGHAELTVHGATFYLSDSAPGLGVEAIGPDDAVHTSLVLSVPDVDAATDRTVEAGARLERPPTDYPYGRMSVIRDPFGHRWMLESPVTVTAPRESDPIQHGDIGFVSVHVPDVERARRFYAAVLGWEYGPDGRLVTNTSLPQGLWATEGTPTLLCSYAVESVDSAVDEVRAAGGTATEPEDRPYGRASDCVDDQGMAFAVYEPRPDNARPALNGSHSGDLAYVTFDVADSSRARAFYGAVLGWRFEPGRVEDGWNVDGPVPMAGLAGGGAGVITPMWRVDDIGAAVGRVREAGGTATDPEQQPYGISSECTDDQGTRFGLGQLS